MVTTVPTKFSFAELRTAISKAGYHRSEMVFRRILADLDIEGLVDPTDKRRLNYTQQDYEDVLAYMREHA